MGMYPIQHQSVQPYRASFKRFRASAKGQPLRPEGESDRPTERRSKPRWKSVIPVLLFSLFVGGGQVSRVSSQFHGEAQLLQQDPSMMLRPMREHLFRAWILLGQASHDPTHEMHAERMRERGLLIQKIEVGLDFLGVMNNNGELNPGQLKTYSPQDQLKLLDLIVHLGVAYNGQPGYEPKAKAIFQTVLPLLSQQLSEVDTLLEQVTHADREPLQKRKDHYNILLATVYRGDSLHKLLQGLSEKDPSLMRQALSQLMEALDIFQSHYGPSDLKRVLPVQEELAWSAEQAGFSNLAIEAYESAAQQYLTHGPTGSRAALRCLDNAIRIHFKKPDPNFKVILEKLTLMEQISPQIPLVYRLNFHVNSIIVALHFLDQADRERQNHQRINQHWQAFLQEHGKTASSRTPFPLPWDVTVCTSDTSSFITAPRVDSTAWLRDRSVAKHLKNLPATIQQLQKSNPSLPSKLVQFFHLLADSFALRQKPALYEALRVIAKDLETRLNSNTAQSP